MDVISFKNALQLYHLGFKAKTQKSYIFQVIGKVDTKIIDGQEYKRLFEDWDRNEKTVQLIETRYINTILSDRFYDSWTDKAIPAYNLFELCQFLPESKINGNIVKVTDDVNEICELMIKCVKIINKVN